MCSIDNRFIFKVKSLPLNIDAQLKSLVCAKKLLPHMKKTIYDPSCLVYCSDLCGVRCKGLCNKTHTGCSRGVLPATFAQCRPSDQRREMLKLDFITFETKEVQTFGQGKPYTRVEKIATTYSYADFLTHAKEEFSAYAEHTLTHWFLRATKLEAFAPSLIRASIVTITADFGEAIQIIAKRETSDQFYHRPEVYQLDKRYTSGG